MIDRKRQGTERLKEPRKKKSFEKKKKKGGSAPEAEALPGEYTGSQPQVIQKSRETNTFPLIPFNTSH